MMYCYFVDPEARRKILKLSLDILYTFKSTTIDIQYKTMGKRKTILEEIHQVKKYPKNMKIRRNE